MLPPSKGEVFYIWGGETVAKGNSGASKHERPSPALVAKMKGLIKEDLDDLKHLNTLAQENFKREAESLPNYLHQGMSENEIKEKIADDVTKNGSKYFGTTVDPSDVDGRFKLTGKFKWDSRIKEINNMTISDSEIQARQKIIDSLGGSSWKRNAINEVINEKVMFMIKNYTTSEMKEFYKQLTGESIRFGTRSDTMRSIEVAIQDRFKDSGSYSRLKRHKLSEPTSVLDYAAGDLKQSLDRQSVYKKRAERYSKAIGQIEKVLQKKSISEDEFHKIKDVAREAINTR